MDQSVSQDFRLKNLDMMWAQVESKHTYAYMLETWNYEINNTWFFGKWADKFVVLRACTLKMTFKADPDYDHAYCSAKYIIPIHFMSPILNKNKPRW